MDEPNITMEEYIRVKEEKAQKPETEFPAIVFNDNLTSNETLSCEPTVSSLNNNDIHFRIPFDESDDEDYTVVLNKISFSYKIISTNDLKTDSENDNEKVNMSLFPSPDPSVTCIDDLDFFKDFENEFPAIVYNDPLTFESNFSTKSTLYFNNLFSFNIIYPDDLKLDKDYDDNKIDMIQSSRDMALPPRDQRHQYLRFEGLQYTEGDIADYEWAKSARHIPDKGDLSAYWIRISFVGDFLGTIPSYTLIRDPILRLCHMLIACSIVGWSHAPKKVTVTNLFHLRGMDVGSVNVPYLLARYLRLFASGKKHGAIFGASGQERQLDAAAGAPEAIEDAPVADEGDLAILAPVQAPQPPPPAARTTQTMAQRLARENIDAGSENRPAILNKENYVPWSSRLLWYDKSRPSGKLIHNYIINGPYVRRMIPEPAVDSCETAQEIWLRVQQMMKGFDIGIQEKKAKLFNEWERINLHTIRDDSLLGTLKFVSKTEDSHKYGALILDDMINQDIKDSKAYKTYYDFSTGKVSPKKARKFKKIASPLRKVSPIKEAEHVKKDKRVKRPAKKSAIVPTAGDVIRDTLGVLVSKKKAPAKGDRGKGIEFLFDFALLEAKSKKDSHMLHASGSGDVVGFQLKVPNESEDKTTGTDKGTGTKPGVLNVPSYESDSDNESWRDSEDASDDTNDDDDDDDNI
nr:hypothetical protein [Tanacetum cinerariifolium]